LIPVQGSVVHCDRPFGTVVDVDADRAVPAPVGGQKGGKVIDDDGDPRVVEEGGPAEVLAVPPDHRRLDLDDRHRGRVEGERLGQREPDPKPADQHPGAGTADRRPHQLPLGPPVPGVHQERAVADDLVVLAVPAQHQLAARRVEALHRDGYHGARVGRP